MVQVTCRNISGVTGVLLALVALGLVAYHTEPHCSYETASGKITECAPNLTEQCPGAFSSYLKNSVGESSTVCPWRKPTYILGLISLSLTQIIMILFVLVLKGKRVQTYMGILGAVVIPLLIAACALMIRDIADGFKYFANTPGTYTFRPITYIVNAVLMLVSISLVAWAIKAGFKMGAGGQNTQKAVVKIDPAAHLHQQMHSDNSQAVPKSNWQDQTSVNVTVQTQWK